MAWSCCSSWGQRPQQFFSATKEVISSPSTPCVLISSAQNKLSKKGLLQLCSSERSECRTSLITGRDLQLAVCSAPALQWCSDIGFSFVVSLPISINGEIVLVCYWYSVMTAPTEYIEQLSKISPFKRKVSRPCLSHFTCEQTQLHLHTIVIVRTEGGIPVDMQKIPSSDFRPPFY